MKNSLSKRLLSLLLCLAMFLSLGGTAFAGAVDGEPTEEPEIAVQGPEEEPYMGSGDEINSNEPPSGRFSPYFRVADDMVGGTVTDNQNIYTNTSALGKQVTAGLTVTLYPHPEAGYEFRSWSVVCVQDEQYYYDVDDYGDWGEFLVGGPYNNRYTFEIRAEFEYIDSGYPIDCYSVDASGLGSSISVDKTDAKVGETVSILVDRKPGTVFDSAPYAFFNTNESYPYSGGYSIPLTKESDSLYTFVVPEDITRYIKQTDQTIYVRAEFALGEYAVTVDSVSDPEGTGNTISADKAGAGLDDEVTVSVMMRYATAYGPEGLQVFWLDEEGRERPVELTLSGSSVSPYSSSGETTYTYTFAMPEHDVHVTADFVKIGHRISTAPVDVPGQTLRGRFFQGETNLSVSPNEQRAVAGDTITAEFHVDHEENMGSYGIRSAWITWEENGATQRRDLENVRYDEYLHFYGDFVMPDADVVLHAELERSWWVVTDHYSGFSLDPDKWEAFVGETVTVTANLFDEGSETFEGWTWHVVTYDENSQPVDVDFSLDPSAPNRISFRMPDGPVSVSIESPYSYISRRWTGSRVEEDVKNPVEFTLISSLQDNENLTSGVWILSQSSSFSNRLTISGDVHLVLCDGATLTCGKGVELAPGNSLSVYGQEEDTGKLICTGPENHAGIGGGNNTGSGSFTIHGGTVTANGGDYAAGVGTGDEASPDSCGSFTMLGGSLTATGGTDGAGVGGGNEVNGGTVTVYDGSLTANGGDYAAGIGGGDEKDGDTVIIYNGTVTTTGGPNGAGIGGGEAGNQGGSVTIYDGTVTTEGGRTAAGISGGGGGSAGNAGHGGTVSICGGTVNVTAGHYAAGIGGGSARGVFTTAGNGGNVSISGGKITIDTGGQSGAGIGGGAGAENFGYAGDGGDVSISGGKLTINMFATRSAGIGGGGCDYECGTSGSVNISGGEISINISSGYIGELYVDSQGAGIGGAAEMDQGGDIRITGGVVLIENNGFGAGIGGGASEKKPSEAGDGGNVYINNAYVVAASHSGAGIGGGGSLKGGGGGGNGGNVTIDGGCVYAISSNKGAGIGGGNDGNGGTLTVNGGYVMATGGYLDYNYIRDHGLWSDDSTGLEQEDQGWTNLAYNLIMHFISSGEYAGAGIGGGDDGDGGTVIINGGTVIAISGMNSASAFGRGDGGDSDGTLAVYPSAKVTYGTVSDEGKEIQELGLAPAGQRNTLPQQYAYARIEPCDHPDKKCTPLDEHEHTVNCSYCGISGQTEPHTFDEAGKTCVDCGYERVIVTLLPGQGSGNAVTVYVTKGEQYTLPECSFTGPNGRSFSGWQGSVNGGEEAAYPAGSSFRLSQDLTLTAQWNDPYQLWVNGVRVTSDNQSDVLGDGTVVYDPETCTLTLNGPVFTDTHEGAMIYADDLDLTITGSGVVSMDESFDTGVRVLSGSLTIDGNISVAGAGTNGLDADEDVILRSGVIAAQGGSYGIRAGRSIYVRRDIDRVTADGRRALSYQEIDVGPGVTVVERTSANRLPPEDEWDLENANHVVFDQGVVVSFVLNGGEMEGETGTVQHNIAEGMTVAKPEPDPTREGYTFSGWYMDEGLTLEFDFETELDEDISLYAKWNKAYPVEIQWEKGDELEQEPESVRVVLQRGRNGEWTTVAELTITAEDEWKGSLEYVPGPDALDSDEFRIREIDESTGLPVCDPDDDLYASDRPTAIFTVGGEQKGYLVSYKQIEEANYIINSSTKQYSVELSWDIDVGDQDRPDEIEVVLQKQEGKFSWKTVQVITLDPSNGWSGEFDTVPLGYVNDTETFVFYEYRVRELRPKTEEEQEEEYGTEGERLEAADERVVHNTFDLDKPFIYNLLMTADPENLWTFDYTVKWLTTQATKITIPPPTFTAEIDTYTDTFGKEIEEHESKYFIAYDHNSTSHHMKITNTAVLDIDIRKIWIGFEDDQMPESVYLMLMSKVDDDYAEQIGVSEINIYTPVATVVYGSQLNINTIPGVEEGISSGIKALLGDGFMSSAAAGTLSSVLTIVTNSGIAIVEAKGDGNNPLTNWRVTMMVKKYGSYGVPMEFAGAELITGLMEMAIDAIIKQLGIPMISCPVMYHPVYECWSIKGYAIPSLHDYSYTCNVINLKFDGDESEIKQISGTKTWVNDTEDQRPDEIVIHVYAKGEDGSRTEITGSPLTVTAENNWAWSMQIPLNDIAVVKVDGENSSVTYKEIEIEEEVPEGYEVSYDGYNITNTYTGTKTVEGHKSWEDDNDADGLRPSSITIRLLADGEEIDARTVTAADDWAWSFPELPEYNASGAEIAYTITEDPVEGYISEIDGYNVTNTIVSRVYGYNVNLKGRIGLNVYLYIPQWLLQKGGLYVTLDGEKFPVADAETRTVNGLTLYKFPVDKAAKEMNDQVTVRLYRADGTPETLFCRDVDVTETGWRYSIQTYIDRSREDKVEPLLLAVVDAMSDYGSLAQAYFHHNEEKRAAVVGDVDAVTEAELAPYEAKLTQGNATGVSYTGGSLVLRSGTVIRHYFSIDEGSVGDYTFKLGSKTVTPVEKENGWMIEIPDVYARNLGNMYTVTVSSSEGVILTLKYSALSYAYKVVQDNDDPALVKLVKSLYLYNRAACAYFDSVEG